MNQDISVPSNRRCKVSILGHRESIMTYLGDIHSGHAEVHGLVHRPCRHYSDQLVERGVFLQDGSVEGLGKLLRGLGGDFKATLLKLIYQVL